MNSTNFKGVLLERRRRSRLEDPNTFFCVCLIWGGCGWDALKRGFCMYGGLYTCVTDVDRCTRGANLGILPQASRGHGRWCDPNRQTVTRPATACA